MALDTGRRFVPFLVSRMFLGSIHPPEQRLKEAVFLVVQRQGHEADHTPHLTPLLRTCGAILPLPPTPSQTM